MIGHDLKLKGVIWVLKLTVEPQGQDSCFNNEILAQRPKIEARWEMNGEGEGRRRGYESESMVQLVLQQKDMYSVFGYNTFQSTTFTNEVPHLKWRKEKIIRENES